VHADGALMNTLTIETTAGEKTAQVTQSNFTDEYPFGFVPYRKMGTSTRTPTEVSNFWDAVDTVLAAHGLNSSHFIRAISAVQGQVSVGEE
jgi:hypothetical protein